MGKVRPRARFLPIPCVTQQGEIGNAAMPIFSAADFRVGQVLQAIESNPNATIPTLAGLVNLSSSRLGHLFKAQTGVSLGSFLARRRLEKAAELLRSTDKRVKEITFAVGYRQESSFVRAFAKKFDCSPTDYRNQQRLLLRNSRFS
jgi:AraC family transcriptional regulator, arabinose operon regulatory protein